MGSYRVRLVYVGFSWKPTSTQVPQQTSQRYAKSWASGILLALGNQEVCGCLCVCMGVVYICVCMCVHVYVCHSVCLCVHVCLDCEIIRHLTFSVKYKLEGPFCYSRIKSFQRERGKTADWNYSLSLLNSLSVFKSSSWKLGKVPETQESADS